MGPHQDFHDLLDLLWSGKVKPVIHQVMPLSEGSDAYKMMEDGRHFGKIVLTP
jgi:NADPH:quinone reductase-like Zn-dependent oxidoreductase